MKITPEQVRSVAGLARLELSEEEVASFSRQLSELVEYFRELDELDTADIEATSHAVPLACPQRADEVRASIDRDAVLDQAPQRDREFFAVPKIID